MNLKQIASAQNKSVEEISEASRKLFGSIPNDFDNEKVSKISEYFKAPKLLGTSPQPQKAGELDKKHQSNIQKKADVLRIENQKIQDEMFSKLAQSAKLEGEYQAKAYTEIKQNAFVQTSLNNDIDFYNSVINGNLAAAIRSGSLANNAGLINQIEQAQIVDVESKLLESMDDKALPPTMEEMRKLLPPSDDELRKLLDSM